MRTSVEALDPRRGQVVAGSGGRGLAGQDACLGGRGKGTEGARLTFKRYTPRGIGFLGSQSRRYCRGTALRDEAGSGRASGSEPEGQGS